MILERDSLDWTELDEEHSVIKHFFPVQDPFITIPTDYRVSVGEQLTLQCDVPDGYPSPRVFWSLVGGENVVEDKRVTTDYEGKVTQIHEITLDVRANMD